MCWFNNDGVVPFPKDGAILDIVLSETAAGIGLTCGLMQDGKITTVKGMDITKHVMKWHRVPDVIYDQKEGTVKWE